MFVLQDVKLQHDSSVQCVYPPGRKISRRDALERELSAATVPICSTQALCSATCHPSHCLPLLMALAADSHDSVTILLLTSPLAIDLRTTSFFFFLHFHHTCPDVLTLSSFAVPESESFARTLSELLQGCLGGSGPSCLDSSSASDTSRQLSGSPNQWSIITCKWRWWMPAAMAVTWPESLCPFHEQARASCLPQLLTSSSVHLQTGSNVTHSQMGGHARGMVQGKKVPLPFHPGSCSPASALFLIFLVFPHLS